MWCVIIVLLAMCASSSIAQPTHNIAVVEITYPGANTRTPLGVPTQIVADFQNTGTSDETNVRLIATISRLGTIVYRDTEYVTNWGSSEYHTENFRDFTPTSKVAYEVCVYAELDGDEETSDNALCHTLDVRLEADIRAVDVLFPNDTTIRQGTALRVRGRFANVGVREHFDVKARVQIKRCADGVLIFQADSTIPELNYDATVEFVFPSKSGSFDTRTLPPGCYDVAVIALLSDDVDRTNDTARNTFTITPLSNNIRVDAVVSPQPGSFKKLGDTVTPSIRFKNSGTKTQVTVDLYLVAYDPSGALVVSDHIITTDWLVDEARTYSFKRFTTTKQGYYAIKAYAVLVTDEQHFDDTVKISIFSGIRNDVRILSVVNPKVGERKQVGKIGKLSITCKAEWSPTTTSYSVPVRAVITGCNDLETVLVLDTFISKLHVDSGETLFVLPVTGNGMSLSQLPVGCYSVRFILRLDNDEVRSNDTMIAMLRVIDSAITDNIVGIKGISPINNTTGPESTAPVPLVFRYFNPGRHDQMKVKVTTTVVHQGKHVVFRDTVVNDFESGDLHDIRFDDLNIPHYTGLGWYTVTTISHLMNDIRKADDTIVTKFARGFHRDSRTASMIMPLDSAVIDEHTAFRPTVLFDCAGLDTLVKNVPVNIRIYNCQTNDVVYTASVVLPQLTLSGTTYAFPQTSSGANTADFPPGCYKIIAMTEDSLDNNLTNDQIYSKFYIQAISAVDQDDTPLYLAQAYPNPATDFVTIAFTLAEPGTVTLRLVAMNGMSQQLIAQQPLAPGSFTEQIDLNGLLDGVYLYELTFSGNNTIRRLAKTLVIAK